MNGVLVLLAQLSFLLCSEERALVNIVKGEQQTGWQNLPFGDVWMCV